MKVLIIANSPDWQEWPAISANTSQQLLGGNLISNHTFLVLVEFVALLHVIVQVAHRLVIGGSFKHRR